MTIPVANTMLDSTNAGALLEGFPAYAGYVDGYADWANIVGRFNGKAHLLPITVFPGVVTMTLDIENGAATIGDARPWLDMVLKAGVVRPVIYAAADSFYHQGLLSDIAPYGDKIRRWIAWWTDTRDIPAGFDAKQYASNMSFDTSVFTDSFFPSSKPPPPPPDYHYDWFALETYKVEGKELSERHVVERYDAARNHPIKYRSLLKEEQQNCKLLAGRVYEVAVHLNPEKDGKPSWDTYHRGWRFQQLIKRSQGKKFT